MEEIMCTSAEAAAQLGVHVQTVNRWCRQGRLPRAYLKAGSRRLGWRIPAGVIDALVKCEEPEERPQQDAGMHSPQESE